MIDSFFLSFLLLNSEIFLSKCHGGTTGFSRCMPDTAPPVLTRSGVVSGNLARLPNLGMEGFYSKNVIRTVVYENAQEYHTVIANCPKLNLDTDLIPGVSETVLEQETVVALIQWWTKFSRVNQPHLTQIRGYRLKDAIRYYSSAADALKGGNERRICKLGDVLFFIEKDSPFSARDIPLPETVFAEDFQNEVGFSALNSEALYNVWFSPFPVDVFAEFISHSTIMTAARPEEELLRIKVLSILSREFMRRQHSERFAFGDLCHQLFSNKRCIPFDSDTRTNFGAEYPTDLYLYSAELSAFDGVGSFHKASAALQSAGITEEFLLVVGVRKSVSIDFLFANLDTLDWSKDPKPLIEYLRTATLTRNDLNMLSSTKYLPAGIDNTKRFAPSELFLPNEDLDIFPFVNTLRWPSELEVSEKSDNGKFLVKLGVRPMPSLVVVLAFLSGTELSEEQREKGLEFVCDRLVPHGAYYSQYSSMGPSERKKYRFLPCLVRNVIDGEHSKALRQSPVDCYSDVSCGVMGFPVLDSSLAKKKGQLYGSLFQCDHEPQTSLLLQRLSHLVAGAKGKINAASDSERPAISKRIVSGFEQIFKYLSHRSADLSYSSIELLKRESFIPSIVDDSITWYRYVDFFFCLLVFLRLYSNNHCM
jgi:Protein of unknown function (DUF3684)